jgi:hypothetical protein
MGGIFPSEEPLDFISFHNRTQELGLGAEWFYSIPLGSRTEHTLREYSSCHLCICAYIMSFGCEILHTLVVFLERFTSQLSYLSVELVWPILMMHVSVDFLSYQRKISTRNRCLSLSSVWKATWSLCETMPSSDCFSSWYCRMFLYASVHISIFCRRNNLLFVCDCADVIGNMN